MKENNITIALVSAMGAVLVLMLGTASPVWFLAFLLLNFVLAFKYNKYYFLVFLVYAAFNYYYSFLVPRGSWSETFLQKIIKDSFALFIYSAWTIEMLAKKKNRFRFTPVLIPVLVFFSVSLMGLVRSSLSNLYLGVAAFRNMVVFVPMFFMSMYYMRDKKDISRMINVLFFAGIVVAVLGIYEFFFSPVLAERVFAEQFAGLLFRRITSTMLYPGNLSLFMVILSVILFSFHNKGIYFVNRLFSYAVLSSYVFTAFLTYARSGIIALVIAFAYLLWKNKRYRTLFVSAIALAVVAVGLYIMLPSSVWRYARLFDQFGSERSVADRTIVWDKPAELAKNDPLLYIRGIGIEKVGTIGTASKFDDKSSGAEIIQTDNYFLQLLLSTGAFGLFSFLMILMLLFYEGGLAYKDSNDRYLRAVALGLKALILVYLFSGMTGSVWELFPNSMYFWALMGLIPAIRRINTGETDKKRDLS